MASKLAIRNRCPSKGETYDLRKSQILTKQIRIRGKSKNSDYSNKMLTYMDFKKYLSNFDTDLRKTQSPKLIDKINFTKLMDQKIRHSEVTDSIKTQTESNSEGSPPQKNELQFTTDDMMIREDAILNKQLKDISKRNAR